MNYTATIKVTGDPEKITKCFEPEVNEKNRANFIIKKEKDHVLFEINAEDSVALRATMNSITKLLTTYEKVEGI